MIYLAQPYSHPDPTIVQTRYEIALEYCNLLRDRHPYSPIVHWHNVASKHDLPTDAAFWRKYNYHMLSLASSLYILRMPGWEQSEGLANEVKYCLEKNISTRMIFTDKDKIDIYIVSPLGILDQMTHGKNNSKRTTHLRSNDGDVGNSN